MAEQVQPGAMIREVLTVGRQAVNRALTVIDSFRPKILIKKPLTEIVPIQGEAVIGGELGGIVERVMSRIEEVRSAARSVVTGEKSGEMNALQIVKGKKKKGVIY